MKTGKDTLWAPAVGALAVANLLHALWTWWLTDEQIKTGWGGGTGIEMMYLMVVLTELICLPALLFGVIYCVYALIRKYSIKHRIAVFSLLLLIVAQYVLTNLFVFY